MLGEGSAVQSVAGHSAEEAVLDRSLDLVQQLCHEIDPRVQVTLSRYRWHGSSVLDVTLTLGGHEHHLEVTAQRMAIILRDPHMLEHDLEGIIHEMEREAGEHLPDIAEWVHTTYDAPHHPPPARFDPLTATPGDPELDPLHSPAAEGVDLPPSHPDATHARPAVSPEDRGTLDRTIELARHIVHELDPDATLSFEEYRWHGDFLLDIAVTIHGHTQHLEVSATRGRIVLRDHELLHHDLEEVVHALHHQQ